MSIELYDGQKTAVSSVLTKWQDFDRLLGVAATGGGKTFIWGKLAEQRINPGPVLILAHRDELLKEPQDKIWHAVGLIADREQASERASLASSIVLASAQTPSPKERLERFPPGHFTTVIVDEAQPPDSQKEGTIEGGFLNLWISRTTLPNNGYMIT